METSVHVTEIVNVLQAISRQNNKLKKKNIILANKENKTLLSVIKYQLGEPNTGFNSQLIYKPCFYIAEPPEFVVWEDLMQYFEEHRDIEDRLVAAQRFIHLQSWEEREAWRQILSKSFTLGNEQYLLTVIKKEENSV